MFNAPEELIRLGLEIGKKSPFWVQGAGGNVSFFDEKTDSLWIKASGARLDRLGETKTLARLPFQKTHEELEALSRRSDLDDHETEKLYAQTLKGLSEKRDDLGQPSMETGFHIFLDRSFVMHFHSVAAVLMGEPYRLKKSTFEAWFKNEFSPLRIMFLSTTRPGFRLSTELSRHPDFDIYILENHGVILQSESRSILSDWREVESSFLEEFNYEGLEKFRDRDLHESLKLAEQFADLALKVYFPDTAVYLEEISEIVKSRNLSIHKGSTEKQLGCLEIVAASALLQYFEPRLQEIPAQMVSEISGLPTEKYRKALSK